MLQQAEVDVDPKLEEKSPRELSYWIALVFSDNPLLQQNLLENHTVLQRLTQQQEILSGTVSFLRAKVALQGAFEPSTEEKSSSEPPPNGGPD